MEQLDDLVKKGIEDDFEPFFWLNKSTTRTLKSIRKMRATALHDLQFVADLRRKLQNEMRDEMGGKFLIDPEEELRLRRKLEEKLRSNAMSMLNQCKQYEDCPESINFINMTWSALDINWYCCSEYEETCANTKALHCDKQECHDYQIKQADLIPMDVTRFIVLAHARFQCRCSFANKPYYYIESCGLVNSVMCLLPTDDATVQSSILQVLLHNLKVAVQQGRCVMPGFRKDYSKLKVSCISSLLDSALFKEYEALVNKHCPKRGSASAS